MLLEQHKEAVLNIVSDPELLEEQVNSAVKTLKEYVTCYCSVEYNHICVLIPFSFTMFIFLDDHFLPKFSFSRLCALRIYNKTVFIPVLIFLLHHLGSTRRRQTLVIRLILTTKRGWETGSSRRWRS